MENMQENYTKNPVEIPKEAREKLEAMKQKLDKYVKAMLKDHKDSIVGIALMPPSKIHPEEQVSEEEKEKKRKAINVLILIDLVDKKDNIKIREQIIKDCHDRTKDIDENISPWVMDIIEVRENCLDGKYEILENLALCAPLFDPKNLIIALKLSEVHKTMVLKKFEKYIVCYAGGGSLFRGDQVVNDIDIYIVIDDTDVKRMTRVELKDKLMAIIYSMSHEAAEMIGTKHRLHIQTYILTDFWESMKDAQPVIYTFLRDGVPFFDRGIFMPWKLLLKSGRLRPSQEAIEMQMDIGDKLILRTKGKMLSILGEDLYYALLNPAQAALMLYGIAPPTPKETIQLMDELFVKREKILEKKYVDMLERIRKYYKDIEHGKIKEVSGKEIDAILRDATDYLARIKKLFDQIQARAEKESIIEIHRSMMQAIQDSLELGSAKFSEKNAPALFKKEFVDKKILPPKSLEALKTIIALKEKKKKLRSAELEKVRRESRVLLRALVDYIQRKRAAELMKARIRFRHQDKYGEMFIAEKSVFIINDVDADEKEISRAVMKDDGSFSDMSKSSLEEFEKAVAEIKIPKKASIKEKTFESLRKLFGKDVEIILNN